MSEFRLTQISDAHLARRLPGLTGNFHRVCDYIDANRPDLVVNSGDLAFDGPTNPDDPDFDLSELAPTFIDEARAGKPWFLRRWLLLIVAVLTISSLLLPYFLRF